MWVPGRPDACHCGASFEGVPASKEEPVEDPFERVTVIVGTVRCVACGADYGYSRWPDEDGGGMATKKKAAKKKPAKKASKAHEKKARPARGPKPRNAPLPGMEDARIQELEDAGELYAEIRDRRMELNKEESDLKATILRLMHKHGKVIYKHEAIEIRITSADEDVKVKIRKAKDDDDETQNVDVEVETAASVS